MDQAMKAALTKLARMGGRARARTLTAARRQEIARLGAALSARH